jgi:hypothetical protein
MGHSGEGARGSDRVSVADQAIHRQGPGLPVRTGRPGPGGGDAYKLADPALHALARIVRGADTDARTLTPESSGLYAAASGFREITRDDFDNMARQFPLYDALYAYCQSRER